MPAALAFVVVLTASYASVPETAQLQSFKAITWNVEQPQGRRLQGVIDFLISQNADVVALQELYEGEAGEMRSQLKARTSRPWNGRFYRGLMIVTHLPVVEHHELWMPYPDRYGPGRPALGIVVEIAGVRVRAFNAHLACCDHVESRQRQIDALSGWIERFGGPAIVAGDFNAEPASPEISQASTPVGRGMAAGYVDLWRGPGGETFRNPQPSRRIDYWFTSKSAPALAGLAPRVLDVCSGWTFTRAEAGEGGPSCLADHRPVEVTFRIAPASRGGRGGAL